MRREKAVVVGRARALLIRSTYIGLRLDIGTGRDERVHHRRVPFPTGPVKRCVANLSVGGAHGAGVGFSEEGREGGDGWRARSGKAVAVRSVCNDDSYHVHKPSN